MIGRSPRARRTGDPGIEAVFDESIEYDDSQLFSGGINPANLPLEKTSTNECNPVYPHHFLKVNTIFEVIQQAGLRTAWSDKHAAYDLVNGPSGTGVMDLYTPEINSLIKNGARQRRRSAERWRKRRHQFTSGRQGIGLYDLHPGGRSLR
jgi:hypothetical protein